MRYNILNTVGIAIFGGAFAWVLASYLNLLQGQGFGGTDAAWNIFVILLKLAGM